MLFCFLYIAGTRPICCSPLYRPALANFGITTSNPARRAIGVLHSACKYEFRRNLRSYGWSVILIFIIYTVQIV